MTTLVDRKYIAQRIGIAVDTLRKNYESQPDYPKPVLRLSRKTVRWDANDIEIWLARRSAQR